MERIYNARPDTLDFRDKIFQPTLVEVPPYVALDAYQAQNIPILDQGREGACTGFGLATVCHYLLQTRAVDPNQVEVSPRMLYEMAKRYDEWPGEAYEGSSARGAMKGWHKHGVCSAETWPYDPGHNDRRLTNARSTDAITRPLGAYYRVNHKDMVALHAAIAEVGILYATASVHRGWTEVGPDGRINYDSQLIGGHAFAIVAYDKQGLWIQNSWNTNWGKDGFGHISYDDWLENGRDVWVARLGVPMQLETRRNTVSGEAYFARQVSGYSYQELRPHIISLGNDGELRNDGTYGVTEEDVQSIFEEDFQRITQNWEKKRLVLYAHGGLVSEKSALDRSADYRNIFLRKEIYPLSFVWKTDYWTTLKNMLADCIRRRRPEGFLDNAKDFMLDRLDDSLEPLARSLTGYAQWAEMKENALRASTTNNGGILLVANYLDKLIKQDPTFEIHIIGHSAGSILHAPLVQLLTANGTINEGPLKGKQGYGHSIDSCTLWAPACTTELFKQTYLPSIQNHSLKQFNLFTLSDNAEQDDNCANIYHKSLLYLVSNAFEEKMHVPLFCDGTPILGMEKFIQEDGDIMEHLQAENCNWTTAPNTSPLGSTDASTARHHGDFDDDKHTVQATIARILGAEQAAEAMSFPHSSSSLQDRRRALN
jgi:hypothetical protein